MSGTGTNKDFLGDVLLGGIKESALEAAEPIIQEAIDKASAEIRGRIVADVAARIDRTYKMESFSDHWVLTIGKSNRE